MIPDIHIQYSPYLDEIYKAWIWSDSRYKDWACPPLSEVKNKTSIFSQAWKNIGLEIIKGICLNTGLDFKRNHFSVYVVSGNTRTYSNPIVMKSGFSEREFVEMLTHELIHCLFVDNPRSSFVKKIDDYADHVVLYAVLESVLPGTIGRPVDVEHFPVNARYLEAMNCVRVIGFREILARCRAK